ncbi:hypothetical protein ABGB09_29595 [Streptomyces sp. B8F3]|uniref:hypothetical protein n=1 Tax=Streptomyces sp. B8F3 TaxID=3153573 RepID=UPI00325E7795
MAQSQLTYDDAVRIRGDILALQAQLARIVREARATKSVAKIAAELQFTEGRIRQLLRTQPTDTDR